MDVLLHLEPNPTPFHCRWDRCHFECCLLPLKPNLSFSAAVLEDENRAFTWANFSQGIIHSPKQK